MRTVLLDTGAIVALLDRSERHHDECKRVVAAIDEPLVTCEAVLAEACYLLRDIKGACGAVLENVDRGVFLVPFRVSASARAVQKLMKQYANVPMDFADACLVAMAEELDTGRVLTLDEDFRVYRWKRTRKFELLLDV